MCALRINHKCTGFRYFLLEIEVLAHRLTIEPSGNEASMIVPDKSLGDGFVFRMAVTVDLWTCLSPFSWHRYGLEGVHEVWP
jgi:hypothetical protein